MNYVRILVLASVLTALAACQPKGATTTATADTSPTLATVNGTAITQNFFDFYVKAISGKKPAELTADQQAQALDNLIRANLVAQEAQKDGTEATADTADMLVLTRLNVLQQAMSEKYLKDKKPSEQELRAEYENQVAALPKLEYHARHILVATEPFATSVVQRLEKGDKFEDVAKK
jgi:peptidyl-prolyl cis-trans isomerase C